MNLVVAMLAPRVGSAVIGIVAAAVGRNVLMGLVLVLLVVILMVILVVVVPLVPMFMVLVYTLLLVVLLMLPAVTVVCAHVKSNKAVDFENKCKYFFDCCFSLYDIERRKTGG